YIFALVIGFLQIQLLSAQNQTVSLYNKDSTLLGTGLMVNNKMDGLWKFTNPKTNQLIQQGNFDQGEKEGTWIVYHPNKQKRIEAEYNNNQLNGSYREYDMEGNLILENIFKDSVL